MDHNSITAHSEHMVRPCRCTFVTCDGKPYVTHVTEDPEVLKPWEENMNDNSPLPKTNVEIPMPSVKPPKDSAKKPTPFVSQHRLCPNHDCQLHDTLASDPCYNCGYAEGWGNAKEEIERLKNWGGMHKKNAEQYSVQIDEQTGEIERLKAELAEWQSGRWHTTPAKPEPTEYTAVVRDVPLSLQVWKDGSHLPLAFLEWLRSQVGKQLVVEAADKEWLKYNDYHTADEVGWRLRTEWLTDIKPVWEPRHGEPVMYLRKCSPRIWYLGWYRDQTHVCFGKSKSGDLSLPETFEEIRPLHEALSE